MIDTSAQEAAVATVYVGSAEKLGLIAAKTPSTDADADSQMTQQLDLSSPTRGRDRRVEKTKELLLKLEQQKKKWQQLQSRNSLRQDVLPNLKQLLSGKNAATPPTSPKSAAVLMRCFKSTESPTGVEDMASVNSGTKDNSENGVVVGVAKGNGAYDGIGGVTMSDSWNSEENIDRILDTLVVKCSKSMDSAESTGTSLSEVSGSIIKGAIETQPIGGAKYYVMVDTKKGQAKIVHEAMPATGREGFKFAMEEKGYEIMEYDFLTGREKKPSQVSGSIMEVDKVMNMAMETQPIGGPKNDITQHEIKKTKASGGYEIMEYDFLTGREKNPSQVSGSIMEVDKVMNMVMETEPIGGPKNDITQHETKKTKASGTGDKSFQSWLDEGFNFALDVAEKIDDDLTGSAAACGAACGAAFRANDDKSDSDEESSPKRRRQKIRERSKKRRSSKGRRPHHQEDLLIEELSKHNQEDLLIEEISKLFKKRNSLGSF